MFERFQSVLDPEFQERFLQPNPYQPVMIGRQAHFIATTTTQKIIYFVTCDRIVPDGFNMSYEARFQPLIQAVVESTLVEIHIILINKIV
jgi:nicotinamide riboside kinase